MKNFKITIKEAIKKHNQDNPTLREVTIKSIADELGMFPQQLSQLGTRFNKQLNLHLTAIFSTDKKEVIKANWNDYVKLDLKVINRLDKIKTILKCEIWDLITEIKE